MALCGHFNISTAATAYKFLQAEAEGPAYGIPEGSFETRNRFVGNFPGLSTLSLSVDLGEIRTLRHILAPNCPTGIL